MALSRKINWNLLHTFVVVAETQSISKAAGILGRGQPAVSAALKNLEWQLGLQLAERGPRYFKLTDAGKLLYREACEICGAIDRISVLLTDKKEVLTGSVRLTIASQMTSPLLNRTLSHFHFHNPRASIYCTVMNSPEIFEALSNRLIHFGICPVYIKRSEFEYFHIFREFCGYYCGEGHPLFRKKNLTVKDLSGHNEITYQTSVFTDELHSITEMRSKMRFNQPLTGVANTLEEVRRMVIAGLGIGAIPVQFAERDVRDGLLWHLPPYEDVMPVDVYLVSNPAVRPSETEKAFLDSLTEEVNMTAIEERTYSAYR